MYKIMGAVFLITGCGGFGFLMGIHYRREIQLLRCLLSALREMEWELKYRITPLPELCETAAAASRGKIKELFLDLQRQLNDGVCAEISGCMNALVQKKDLPQRCGKCLRELGRSLGRYDLEGQIQGLQAVQAQCESYLDELEDHRVERLRSYQTLALCAGTALVILLV